MTRKCIFQVLLTFFLLGFQGFSLQHLRSIKPDGIEFKSHIDGTNHFFSPESTIKYQEKIGADIIMPLDQCIAYTENFEEARAAMERTHQWLARCKKSHRTDGNQALFGIVQGGVFMELREESSAYVASLDPPGYAIP